MEAVLYICHGSRMKKACDEAKAFVETCMEKINVPIQEVSFLELAAPTIEQGFQRCLEQGATKIYVVPVLLLTAAHAKKDIPEELEELHVRYPNIEIVYGRPFGVHESIADILYERLIETGVVLDDQSLLLVVGRGSSDPDVKRDLENIVSLVKRKYRIPSVQTCFLTACEPILEDTLDQILLSSYSKVFIVPYLLFTGLLMKRIEKAVKGAQERGGQQYILTHYLEYHPYLQEILTERVQELATLQVSEGKRFVSLPS